MSQEKFGNILLGSVKSENYLNILKKENSDMDNKLKQANTLLSHLQDQIKQNEKNKKELISISIQKDNDIKVMKKKLGEAKLKMDELKNKSQKVLNLKINKSEGRFEKDNKKVHRISELRKKITDLELKIQTVDNNKNFPIISNVFHFSLSSKGGGGEQHDSPLPEIPEIQNNDEKLNDFFLTGQDELLEMKDNNKTLKEKISILRSEIIKHEDDKNKLKKEFEQYDLEHNCLLKQLNEKDLEINGKLNKENELNNNLINQLMENKKIQNNLNIIKIKIKKLEKNKNELEGVIRQQEKKVNELSSSLKDIINIAKMKNIEINNNQIYINNLEQVIKDLNNEFRKIRQYKKSKESKEIKI